MYHDERVLCYSMKPVNVSEGEVERFEKTGKRPELIKAVKSGNYPESCVVKELSPVEGGLKPLDPLRKCVVISSGFEDTVINYVECENGLLTVARLV